MNNVVTFPAAARATASSLAELPNKAAAATIVSLERWKSRTMLRRTANGVFFSTGVLITHGDIA